MYVYICIYKNIYVYTAFGHFFKSTPTDLIGKGLYDALALAMHTGEYRQVQRYRSIYICMYIYSI